MQLIAFIVVCTCLIVAVMLATIGEELATLARKLVDLFQPSSYENDLYKIYRRQA